MKRILVAIDEGESSERVAEFVNDFFADIDAEILAINVTRMPMLWLPGSLNSGWVYPWSGVGVDRDAATRALQQSELQMDEAIAAEY